MLKGSCNIIFPLQSCSISGFRQALPLRLEIICDSPNPQGWKSMATDHGYYLLFTKSWNVTSIVRLGFIYKLHTQLAITSKASVHKNPRSMHILSVTHDWTWDGCWHWSFFFNLRPVSHRVLLEKLYCIGLNKYLMNGWLASSLIGKRKWLWMVHAQISLQLYLACLKGL